MRKNRLPRKKNEDRAEKDKEITTKRFKIQEAEQKTELEKEIENRKAELEKQFRGREEELGSESRQVMSRRRSDPSGLSATTTAS